MSITSKIFFHKETRTYHSGEIVTGSIEYVFKSNTNVSGVRVEFEGSADTSWRVMEEYYRWRRGRRVTHHKYVLYTGYEHHLSRDYVLFGDNFGNEEELPAGPHVFNFECRLPRALPSTYTGQYGEVSYSVTVFLDRHSAQTHSTTEPFYVFCGMDLNENPLSKIPLQTRFEKTFCCMCCISGPALVQVYIPYSGYCPGEDIPIQVRVQNNSRVKVKAVRVLLRELAQFYTKKPRASSRMAEKELARVEKGPAPPHTTTNLNMKLKIPPDTTPAPIFKCNIIEIDYQLKIICVAPLLYKNEESERGVLIGTVPLVKRPATALDESESSDEENEQD